MSTSLLYLYTESPLHAGTGSTTSVIDLPIQRERITGYPHVYGSGVKGALRSQADAPETEKAIVFGPDTDNASDYAGAVSIGEARLVLFPVRSLTGIFAHATCPFILARLMRDLAGAGLNTPDLAESVANVPGDSCLISSEAEQDGGVAASNAVVLDEYTFKPETNDGVTQLANWLVEHALPSGPEYDYWRTSLAQRLVILPDDAFRDFALYSTRVTTRIRIQKDTKTVQEGALWTQEALPTDALLVSTVLARKARAPEVNLSSGQIQEWMHEALPPRIQLGGDETTGHGIVALNWQNA